MFNKERLKGFIAGICVTSLALSVATAFARNDSIWVSIGDIKVFWDGAEQTLTDAFGNVVEPIVYEGTTYVPVRAMSRLMGKDVNWDAQNKWVYVGEKPVSGSIMLDKLDSSKVDHIDMKLKIEQAAQFRLKDETILCSNLLLSDNYQLLRWEDGSYSEDYNTYILNNKYSKMKGMAVIPYEHIGDEGEGVLSFYSVENNGEEHKLQEYNLSAGDKAIDVDVDLVGVENLKVALRLNTSNSAIAFYNISLLAN